MSETGVVKFRCEHIATPLGAFNGFDALNACRRELRALGLLGVGPDGIGFGNLSMRDDAGFIISGSGTGALEELQPQQYARVTAYDLPRNWLRCEGGTAASSESLTHAAVYELEPTARAVIHCHSAELWHELIDVAPTTSAVVEYGTPAMAAEVGRLFAEKDLRTRRLFVMAGHQDGLVAFGATLDQALALLRSRG